MKQRSVIPAWILLVLLIACGACGPHQAQRPKGVGADLPAYALVAQTVVTTERPPARLGGNGKLTIVLWVEQRADATDFQEQLQPLYPEHVLITTDDVLEDGPDKCFRDKRRDCPAVGVAIYAPRVVDADTVVFPVDVRQCQMGMRRNLYWFERSSSGWRFREMVPDGIA